MPKKPRITKASLQRECDGLLHQLRRLTNARQADEVSRKLAEDALAEATKPRPPLIITPAMRVVQDLASDDERRPGLVNMFVQPDGSAVGTDGHLLMRVRPAPPSSVSNPTPPPANIDAIVFSKVPSLSVMFSAPLLLRALTALTKARIAAAPRPLKKNSMNIYEQGAVTVALGPKELDQMLLTTTLPNGETIQLVVMPMRKPE